MSSGNVVPLTAIVKTLRADGGDTFAARTFPDQTIVDLMQTALDFHYEDGIGEDGQPMTAEDFMIEDMLAVMADAEDAGTSKVLALYAFFEEVVEANADDIETALRGEAWVN